MARVRIKPESAAGRGYLKTKIDNRVTLYFFHDRDTIVDDETAKKHLASCNDLEIRYDKKIVEKKKVKVELEEEPKEEVSIDSMNKKELEEFAREKFDYELDRRKSRKALVKEVKDLME